MDQKNLQSIIDYYVGLLIIQYHNKPKAMATIQLFAEVLNANGIIFDVQAAYNLDTAVGIQLDVMGKYAGVNRFYNVVDLINFFALTDYDEVSPDAEDKFGFTTYAGFEDFQYNGTLNYNSFLSNTNRLNDDDYRIIIRLKILENNMNYSNGAIDAGIFEIFGNDVIPSSNGNMKMYYLVTGNLTPVIRAALAKNLLPHPMGVGVGVITDATEPFFGFATYGPDDTALYSANILGFTTYADYSTSTGQTLTFDQIEG